MSASVTPTPASSALPWWKEPTKDQWQAYIAAWLGWTLDAFDFTIFLLIMVPISQEFGVPLTAVPSSSRSRCGCAWPVRPRPAGWPTGWGRKAPLMISILWYSICNFIAGFSPTFTFLFIFRALLGIGMGAEWPAGAALAMESWPTRSRGFMSGILQGSWGLGFALSAAGLRLPLRSIGWRGLLWIGILPALVVVWIRFYVKEPEVWVENKRQQTEKKAEVKAPLFSIFKRELPVTTRSRAACGWQRLLRLLLDLGAVLDLSAEGAATGRRRWWPRRCSGPTSWSSPAAACGAAWPTNGAAGRRSSCRPSRHLRHAALSVDQGPHLIIAGFILQGIFGGSIYGQNPSYLSSASRPRCGPRPRASSTTRVRSGAA